jgi:hypothetical protein
MLQGVQSKRGQRRGVLGIPKAHNATFFMWLVIVPRPGTHHGGTPGQCVGAQTKGTSAVNLIADRLPLT